MYTTYNREILNADSSNTKYTEYLKTLEGAGANDVRDSSDSRHNPLLPISSNEVKFSNIFSPHESNALKLQLLQKTSSLPILDQNINTGETSAVGASGVVDANGNVTRRRRSTSSDVVHEDNNNVIRKTDSVANILYSTIRHGHDYEHPPADEILHTGSDSKVDYDPHEPLPAVDQIALRHELLNNIRAISRATYFEDLYTGKVRRNSGSPEGEILRLLENPQEAANSTTIPSQDASLSRVDRWVKESSEVDRANETDEDKGRISKNTSLYHQSVWNEKTGGRNGGTFRGKRGAKNGGQGDTTDEGSLNESDVETASAYLRRTNHGPPKAQARELPVANSIGNGSSTSKKFSTNTDNTNHSIIKANIPPGIISSTSQYLQAKYLGYDSDLGTVGKKRPFSFGYSTSEAPLSLSLPNVAQNSHGAMPFALPSQTYKSHSISRPENLSNSLTNISSKRSDKTKVREINHNEQVRKRQQQPFHQKQVKPVVRQQRAPVAVIRRSDHRMPGIYTRLNMNQWVVTKVWFYVNGDELFPRFEYRFRQGKDIRDLDQILDILTKRIPSLPLGARYIFTLDGYLINSLDEILNEQSYVVSSTRKFKTLKHNRGSRESGNQAESKRLYNGNVHTSYPPNQTHQGLSLDRRLSSSDGNLNDKRESYGVNDIEHYQSTLSIPHSFNSTNAKSASDVSKVVAHVIEASASNPMGRQPIRVINGSRPSIQSQVLLNTKTSQPFEDLVKDLAISVKLHKQPLGTRLATLTGRQIESYSQLRSELKAGQRAFYVFSDRNEKTEWNGKLEQMDEPSILSSNKSKPLVKPKSLLGQVNSNSSSEISSDGHLRQRRKAQQRRKSRTPTPSPIGLARLPPKSNPSSAFTFPPYDHD